MKKRASLRLRVAFGIGLLAVLSLGLFSILLYFSTDHLEEDLIVQITADEMENFVAQVRRNPAASPPVTENLRGYLATDTADRMQLPAPLRDLSIGRHEVLFDENEYHVVIRDEPEGRFILAYNKEYNEQRERNQILLLIVGTVTAALATAALAYWVSGLLVRPVRTLVDRVENLGPGRTATPLSGDYGDEEITRLAHAFDDYQERVDDLIQREREFTANISHELRTPLTAIRTGCELLLQDPGLKDNVRRRVGSIDRAARRLADTARSLLYLARGADDSLRLEEISIQECVGEAAEPVLPVLANKGIVLETAIDPSATVRAERTALFLVVDNLLRNAAYYTEQGRIRAVYRDGCLTIEDSGPGIEASVLQRVGERFYRGGRAVGDEGLGLGLAIVKRICERFEWRLEIASSTNAGTRVSVHFPLPASHNLHTSSTVS